MKFDYINHYLIGNFLYKYFNNLLPHVFINFFTKTFDVHEHYTRAVGGFRFSTLALIIVGFHFIVKVQ